LFFVVLFNNRHFDNCWTSSGRYENILWASFMKVFFDFILEAIIWSFQKTWWKTELDLSRIRFLYKEHLLNQFWHQDNLLWLGFGHEHNICTLPTFMNEVPPLLLNLTAFCFKGEEEHNWCVEDLLASNPDCLHAFILILAHL
jgi:hypothetical protein